MGNKGVAKLVNTDINVIMNVAMASIVDTPLGHDIQIKKARTSESVPCTLG
jgi:hypothetical protein